MARCKAIIRGRGCKARHQKQLHSTVSFLDRPEFRNFAKCAPDAVPPATESAPPWGPAVEPEPAQGPAAVGRFIKPSVVIGLAVSWAP